MVGPFNHSNLVDVSSGKISVKVGFWTATYLLPPCRVRNCIYAVDPQVVKTYRCLFTHEKILLIFLTYHGKASLWVFVNGTLNEALSCITQIKSQVSYSNEQTLVLSP